MIFITAIVLMLIGANGVAVPAGCWIVYAGWVLIQLVITAHNPNDEP